MIIHKAFSESIVFKSLHSGERFRMAPFSVIVFGVVVRKIAVYGAKQLRFRLFLYCKLCVPESMFNYLMR